MNLMRLRDTDQCQDKRRGAAIVELALLLPLFLILISGMWEAGRIAEAQQVMTEAARQGGRQASTRLVTNSGVKQIILTYLNNANLATQNATITVANLTHPGVDATSASQLDQLQITVAIPFKDVRWVSLPLVTSTSTQIVAQSTWYSMADLAYPAPAPPAIE
jgi:Flp pilus assembly protein TadG